MFYQSFLSILFVNFLIDNARAKNFLKVTQHDFDNMLLRWKSPFVEEDFIQKMYNKELLRIAITYSQNVPSELINHVIKYFQIIKLLFSSKIFD